MMPVVTIMITEKTASRASVGLGEPCSMIEATIETSMAVTAKVSTSVPSGSPTRAATTSALWTQAKTVAIRRTRATSARMPFSVPPVTMRTPMSASDVKGRAIEASPI